MDREREIHFVHGDRLNRLIARLNRKKLAQGEGLTESDIDLLRRLASEADAEQDDFLRKCNLGELLTVEQQAQMRRWEAEAGLEPGLRLSLPLSPSGYSSSTVGMSKASPPKAAATLGPNRRAHEDHAVEHQQRRQREQQ